MQWKNVDLERREALLDQSLAKVRESCDEGFTYSYRIKDVKTEGSRRRVILPDKAMEMLLYFKKYRKNDDSFVCVNDKNQKHYTVRQVERTLERIVKND